MPDLISPWHPMTDPVDIKHLGKLAEEVNELGTALARCLIQGIDEAEPVTGKINRAWLEDEIADVLAGVELAIERFALNGDFINARKLRKISGLRRWHRMA